MKSVKYQRSKQGELNRIASIPKGKKHWNWSENPTILAMHKRIHRAYGRAKSFKCTLCINQAHDWALIGKEYTDNKDDYQPLCRSCHLKKDKNWIGKQRNKHKIIRDEKGRIKTTLVIKDKHNP